MSESGSNEAVSVYLRLKALFGAPTSRRRGERAKDNDAERPFGAGRDARALGDVIANLTQELGWDSDIERSALLAQWPALVGEALAEKTEPIGIEDGVLTVACASTAWAAQLRTMRNDLLRAIAEGYPDAGILSIRFNGPDVPSWKKGPRSIPGRGPRDTYG